MGSYGEVGLKPSSKATYSATSAPVARAASATDMFVINGSASKTVKVLKVFANYSAAASGVANYLYLVKQSTAGSGGTSTTITACPLDSSNAAASAVVKDYTANRTVGTTVANVGIFGHAPFVSANNAAIINQCIFDSDKYGQAMTLRGTAEGLAVSNNGVTIPGGTPIVGFTVVWTEE